MASKFISFYRLAKIRMQGKICVSITRTNTLRAHSHASLQQYSHKPVLFQACRKAILKNSNWFYVIANCFSILSSSVSTHNIGPYLFAYTNVTSSKLYILHFKYDISLPCYILTNFSVVNIPFLCQKRQALKGVTIYKLSAQIKACH